MTRYIVVVGGVISGVGKGVASASIGRMLKEHGFDVTAVKIDPYINCDAGTLRPTEHGEVWVTDDGGETDQDLGNYERFLGVSIPKINNITTGQVYKTVIEKERRGEFLGETVQLIPHVTSEIQSRIEKASEGHDIAIVEVGGTVGDLENIPFLFAAKSLEHKVGKDNIIYILVTYLPIPSHIDEMKTKPTQLSVKLLLENGIQPDFILCRGKKALDEVRKRKIEIYSNLSPGSVISMPDAKGPGTANTTYVIPLNLEKEEFTKKLMNRFGIVEKKVPDWTEWKAAVERITNPQKEVKIAIVGKYVDIGDYTLADSYISINKAMEHAGSACNARVNIGWVDSKELEKAGADPKQILAGYDGIIIPGGFGSTGVEGKINAIRYCRENNIPFLGLCYGLQLAVVEYSRNVCGLDGANTTEIEPNAKYKVIDILPEQRAVSDKGATMRLGAYRALLKEGTLVRRLYGNSPEASERHRHRYEVNPDYHSRILEGGLVFSGMSPDSKLVEFIELPESKHIFFVGTQAHPEFKSSLLKPAPLFKGFIEATLKGKTK
jgi:CTP synthase